MHIKKKKKALYISVLFVTQLLWWNLSNTRKGGRNHFICANMKTMLTRCWGCQWTITLTLSFLCFSLLSQFHFTIKLRQNFNSSPYSSKLWNPGFPKTIFFSKMPSRYSNFTNPTLFCYHSSISTTQFCFFFLFLFLGH